MLPQSRIQCAHHPRFRAGVSDICQPGLRESILHSPPDVFAKRIGCAQVRAGSESTETVDSSPVPTTPDDRHPRRPHGSVSPPIRLAPGPSPGSVRRAGARQQQVDRRRGGGSAEPGHRSPGRRSRLSGLPGRERAAGPAGRVGGAERQQIKSAVEAAMKKRAELKLDPERDKRRRRSLRPVLTFGARRAQFSGQAPPSRKMCQRPGATPSKALA